jgi:nucleotide-binding universal stress UspA family protein
MRRIAAMVRHKSVLTIAPGAREPRSATELRFTSMLCAIDFSPSSIRAFEQALALAERDDSRVTLLHVLGMLADDEARTVAHFHVAEYTRLRRQEAIAELTALITNDDRLRRHVVIHVELGSAAEVILRVAREVDASLTAMGTGGGLGARLFGSTTHAVISGAGCPVLSAGLKG